MNLKTKEKQSVGRLFARLRDIYQSIPISLRLLFYPILLIYRIVPYLLTNQWSITGQEKNSRHDLNIIYTGFEENKNYVADLVFGSSRQEKRIGKKWLWQTIVKGSKNVQDCSLIITEGPEIIVKIFRSKYDFSVPCWVHGKADISGDTFHKFRRDHSIHNSLRKIAKNGLYCQQTNDDADFEYFYRNMYLPFITQRYGTGALLANYYSLKTLFEKGDLLLVKKGEEPIAGGLVGFENNSARCYILGVKDANRYYIQLGAIGALYYFELVYFRDRGYNEVNLGDSRPFLKDGVLNFKKKWNLSIDSKYEIGFMLKILRVTPGTKAFLINNPFMYVDKTGINGAIFVDNEQSLSKSDLVSTGKKYYFRGLNRLCVYHFAQNNKLESESIILGSESYEANYQP
jgi:hypothetical protein